MKRTMVLLSTVLMIASAHGDDRNTITPLSSAQVVQHIRAELPATPTAESRTERLSLFASLDRNRDGQVSFREMRRHPGLVRSFNSLDLNNDGVLSQEELQPLQEGIKRIKGLLTLSIARVI